MGHIWGEFTPTNEYQLIQSQVQEFNGSQKNRDYKKWYSFRFNTQLENGYFILPIGGIEIFDFAEFPDEPLEVHLAGIYSHAYFDFFENNLPFVIGPWQRLNIDQKIDLEDELYRTIGETNVRFSALAKHGSNGDVLFAIHSDNVPPFVIANVGSGHTTIAEIFPEENYFGSFDQVRERMVTNNAV